MDRRSDRHAGVLTCIPVTLVLVALLSLVASAPAKAAGWKIQLQGQDTWVEHVSAVSGTDAWLIQDDPPKLMHTGDGQYWYDADNTGLTGDLDTVAFATSLVGCVLAHSGKVAYTTDGGATWDIVQTTCSSGEISFADSKNGWMGGVNPRGKLLHTTDGGATWEEQQFETPAANSVAGVAAVDAQTCWALVRTAAGPEVLRTTNAGVSWTHIAVPAPAEAFLCTIAASDADHAWLGGGTNSSRLIMATADAGVTWSTQLSAPSGGYVESLDVLKDGLHAWAVAGDGVVFSTTDGGTTWAAQVSGVDTILLDVDFVDASTGWTTGTSGVVLHTSDGGGPADKTPPVTTPSRRNDCWVNASNANLGFTATDAGGVGAWRIYYAVDGGPQSWGWAGGFTVTLASPPSDGAHKIKYHAVDKAGNEEQDRTFTLNVDTKPPVAGGLKKTTVKRGKYATIRFTVNDLPPCAGTAGANIVIARKGKLPSLVAGTPLKKAGKQTFRFKCKLKKGVYQVFVTGRDAAGNLSRKTLKSTLTVK